MRWLVCLIAGLFVWASIGFGRPTARPLGDRFPPDRLPEATLPWSAAGIGGLSAGRPVDPASAGRHPVPDVEAARGAVTGAVRREDGTPVAGARIHATLTNFEDDPIRWLGTATTDECGRYRIPLGALESCSPLARAGLWVGLEAEPPGPGWSGTESVELESDVAGAPFAVADLTVDDAVATQVVVGHVVDGGGRPVGGAEVTYLENGSWIGVDVRVDGSFRLEIDPDVPATELSAFHPRVGIVEGVALALGASPAVHEVLLTLRPRGAQLCGRIRFVDGTPARGVSLFLSQCDDDEDSRELVGERYATVRTDHAGWFCAVGLAAGRWDIGLPDHGIGVDPASEDPDGVDSVLHESGARPCEILLRRGRLRVEVVDADGRPVRGCGVRTVVWEPGVAADRAAITLACGRSPDAATVDEGETDDPELDPEGVARLWLDPGAVVAWQVVTIGAVPVHGWARMPSVATDVRRRVVVRTSDPGTGVVVRAAGGGDAAQPATLAAWRPWFPGLRVSLPLPAVGAEKLVHAIPRDGRVPLPPGQWTLQVGFAPHTCLLPQIVDVDVPPDHEPVRVDVRVERGARIAARFVWGREQVGPDLRGGGPCGNPYLVFAPSWRMTAEDVVELELSDPAGTRIRKPPEPRPTPLETTAARVLPVGPGAVRLRMSVFEPVELETTLTAGWNRFVVRVDRRGKPVSIARDR